MMILLATTIAALIEENLFLMSFHYIKEWLTYKNERLQWHQTKDYRTTTWNWTETLRFVLFLAAFSRRWRPAKIKNVKSEQFLLFYATSCKEESETLTLTRCSLCKIYFYCGKDCQVIDWKHGKHSRECKQLEILKKYNRPYANEIGKGLKRGDNPCDTPALQKLRKKLRLTRPREDYEEYLSNNYPNPYELIHARKDGTVHIGSTPKSI